MGLDSSDPRPTGIALRPAYEAIRTWLQANASYLASHPPRDAYRDFRPQIEKSLPLIEVLPPSDSLSEVEIRTIMSEVIMGKLEWAYHQSDGKYKIAAYAHAALDHAGLSVILTDEEKRALRETGSQILPMLSRHIVGE
ncbi:hypothetical protein [Kallotenue papyrolyticum]|uniref:hypothetical protein n=1 Tax=Kallotenue papyrolyticum TaxID=1325125 RepID=UPI0004929CFF|nr:hypothetical protein [Kallotenue papyrolyticum]